jgi:hypothetical protein
VWPVAYLPVGPCGPARLARGLTPWTVDSNRSPPLLRLTRRTRPHPHPHYCWRQRDLQARASTGAGQPRPTPAWNISGSRAWQCSVREAGRWLNHGRSRPARLHLYSRLKMDMTYAKGQKTRRKVHFFLLNICLLLGIGRALIW